MVSLKSFGLVSSLVLFASAAAAQGIGPSGPASSEPVYSGRSAATCCNPAAHQTGALSRPRGVYVGMPLQPHDLGYTGRSE